MISASDTAIFKAAREAQVIIMSKDADFVKLIELHGVPPQLIWITCGNTSNKAMSDIIREHLDKAIDLLNNGESIVEIH